MTTIQLHKCNHETQEGYPDAKDVFLDILVIYGDSSTVSCWADEDAEDRIQDIVSWAIVPYELRGESK